MSTTLNLASPTARSRSLTALAVMIAMVAMLFSPLATSPAAADGSCANTYHNHWYALSYRNYSYPYGSMWKWVWTDQSHWSPNGSVQYDILCSKPDP